MQSILGNTRKADITFHRGGRIHISARIAKSLNLSRGDVVDIATDGGETLLYVKHHAPTVGRHEGMVFPSNKRGYHCVASSATLCRYILSLCGDGDRASLCCGTAVDLPPYGKALPIIIKYKL